MHPLLLLNLRDPKEKLDLRLGCDRGGWTWVLGVVSRRGHAYDCFSRTGVVSGVRRRRARSWRGIREPRAPAYASVIAIGVVPSGTAGIAKAVARGMRAKEVDHGKR
jgi:hypothetical protein